VGWPQRFPQYPGAAGVLRRRDQEIQASHAAGEGEWCDVATQPQLIVSASRLEEEHTLSFWDALIVQAAIRAGAERLMSEDLQDGRRFGMLTIENPFHKV
jgi:predicted nucleic acid-binding protein